MTNVNISKIIDIITEPFFTIDGDQKGHYVEGFDISSQDVTIFVPTLDIFDIKKSINRIVPKLNELGYDVTSFVNNRIIVSAKEEH